MVAVVLSFTGLLYGLRAINQTPDGLSYAVAVRTGLDMFHPHHMIYVPVARWLHLATGVDPITATLWQNLFWTVVLGLAAWRLAGRIFPLPLARILAVGALLATRGVMIYSVRVETYLPALACLTLATSLASDRPNRPWLLGPVLALAVLYHQTNVLFVFPLLVLLFSGGRGPGFSGYLWRAGVTFAGAAILVAAVYLAGYQDEGPPNGFWTFLLSYARAPIEAWGNFGYYSPSGILALAVSQARMILPVREGTALVGGILMVGALVFLAAWHCRRIRQGCDAVSWRLFSLLFLAVYLLFFLWWMPGDMDFFLATLLPLWLLVLLLIRDLPPVVRSWKLGAGLVLILAVGNLVFTVLPMHRDPGVGRALAEALDREAPPAAVLITGYAVQQELLYFTDRTKVHEGDGLVRAVLDGEPPWSGTGDEEPVVVVDGSYLRALGQRNDPQIEIFLRWLVGFDEAGGSCRTFVPLPSADGWVVGPGRHPATSWATLETEIRNLLRP